MSLIDMLDDRPPDRYGVLWRAGGIVEANELLARRHYLGPITHGKVIVGVRAGVVVAVMVWRLPTSRHIPTTWLELSRWCLTPEAGLNAGSRMHSWAVRFIRAAMPAVTTLVSYSDHEHGHTGALYRACNWQWAPTWLRLRTPPSGNGDWGTGERSSVKDRWIFCLRDDPDRAAALAINDDSAVRHWLEHATDTERQWAARSLNLAGVA